MTISMLRRWRASKTDVTIAVLGCLVSGLGLSFLGCDDQAVSEDVVLVAPELVVGGHDVHLPDGRVVLPATVGELEQAFGRADRTLGDDDHLLIWDYLGIRAYVHRTTGQTTTLDVVCSPWEKEEGDPKTGFGGRILLVALEIDCGSGKDVLLKDGFGLGPHGWLSMEVGEHTVVVYPREDGGADWISIVPNPGGASVESRPSVSLVPMTYVQEVKKAVAAGRSVCELTLSQLFGGRGLTEDDLSLVWALLVEKDDHVSPVRHDDVVTSCEISSSLVVFAAAFPHEVTTLLAYNGGLLNGRARDCVFAVLEMMVPAASSEVLECSMIDGYPHVARWCLDALERFRSRWGSSGAWRRAMDGGERWEKWCSSVLGDDTRPRGRLVRSEDRSEGPPETDGAIHDVRERAREWAIWWESVNRRGAAELDPCCAAQ